MSMFEETPNNEGNTTNTPINIVDDPKKSSVASKVWDHIVTVKLSGGQAKNRCKHCGKLLSFQKGGTTTHLLRHLKQACPARHKIFHQQVAGGLSQSTLQRVLRKHQAVRWPSPVNKRRKSNDSVEHENKDSQATMEQKGVSPLSGGLVDGLASGSGVIEYKKQSKITSQDHAVEGLDTVIELKHVVEIQNVASDVACDQIQNVVVENNVRNLIVKARYKDDFIKFLLPTSSKFEKLQQEVIKRLKLQVGSFSMKYLDEDKDWIITTCDDDLQVAVYSCLSINATVMHMLIQEI